MKVSVIIPVKNRADLLPHTLDNILTQSLKPYEVIVVDDASTDNLQNVIAKYKSEVIFILSSGTGPGAARNTGLKIATGDAIQFFDSDDLMTKNKLKTQAELLGKEDIDFVYGPWVKASYHDGSWKQLDAIMQYYPVRKKSLVDLVLQGWCNITQSALFRRDFLSQVGPWCEQLMTHEDFEFWFRVGKVTKAFLHEKDSCVIYRQHEQQITGSQVALKQKWRNHLSAIELIRTGLSGDESLKSLFMFNLNDYSAKRGYILKFQEMEGISLDNKYKYLLPVSKMLLRYEHFRTRSQWQSMHGVLVDEGQQFGSYIKELGEVFLKNLK